MSKDASTICKECPAHEFHEQCMDCCWCISCQWHKGGFVNTCEDCKKSLQIAKTDEALHHIKEGKKLLVQGRFTIQEVTEKLSFLMSDLWLVIERLDSIEKTFMEDD